MFDWLRRRMSAPTHPVVSVDDLPPVSAFTGQQSTADWDYSIYDGGKFSGGFGPTQIWDVDYWTLRARSAQLFTENLYARGLIRRLVTNEIGTGLTPESCPDANILGMDEDVLTDWTEDTENRFLLWGTNPGICDWQRLNTLGAIQRAARLEALVGGDVLVVLRRQRGTDVPAVQLIPGQKVRSPIITDARIPASHTVQHGVEFDRRGRRVAFWVEQDDGTAKRLPAYGRKSGRKLAWLVYGTDKRHDDVRGQPLLAIVLQSLKEIDRYRDSTQRKAVVNSLLAMFIKKTEDKVGTLPVTGGARRKDTATVTDSDGDTRDWSALKSIPGIVFEELQTGEEPVAFNQHATDANFGVFEEAIIQAVAWASEIPPEILRLAFSNNYSASQAAINEFKIYLDKIWSYWGESFCAPIWIDWLLSEVLAQRVTAPGLLDSWRRLPASADVFGAWTAADWYGSIKPSTDMVKQAKGSGLLVDRGWSTNAREARINTGTRFSKNVKRLQRENEMLVEARRPLAEFQAEFQQDPEAPADGGGDDAPPAAASELESFIDDYLESRGI